MPEQTEPTAEPETFEEPKPKRFPTAFTVLAIVLLAVWIASFIIPSGTYEVDPKTGGYVPGTYSELPSCDETDGKGLCSDKGLVHQFNDLWAAPTNGLYGIENGKGEVSVDNEGFLYGAAQIFLFVLAIGAFISVTMKTGAIQAGIGRAVTSRRAHARYSRIVVAPVAEPKNLRGAPLRLAVQRRRLHELSGDDADRRLRMRKGRHE